MNEDEITFEIECDVCLVETEVTVILDREVPAYCPMCGSPVEVIGD